MPGVSEKLAKALAKPAKTRKGKRILEKRGPLVHENDKNCMFLRGRTTPQVQNLMSDLKDIRKPLMVNLQRRQQNLHPFENAEPIEYLGKKNDCSLFCLGSASKKRPFRLLLGRTFNAELLDMQEFKVSDYKSVSSFAKGLNIPVGAKPMLVFQGDAFDHDETMKTTKSLLADFFKGPKADKIHLNGLSSVIVISCLESASGHKVSVRRYQTAMKKTGTKLPHVELDEVGPRFSLEVDRQKSAQMEIMKLAMRVPKEQKVKKQKNVTTDALGRRKGKIHLGRQEIDKMHTPHFHGKKGKKGVKKTVGKSAITKATIGGGDSD